MSYDKLIKYDYKIQPTMKAHRSLVRKMLNLGCFFILPLLALSVYLFYPGNQSSLEPQAAVIPLALPVSTIDDSHLENTVPARTASNEASLSVSLPLDPVVADKTDSLLVENTTPKAPVIEESLSSEKEEPAEERSTPAAAVPEKYWQKVVIGKGDNLSLIFGRMGLKASLLYKIINHDEQTRALKRVMPGQKLLFQIEGGQLQEMVYQSDLMTSLSIRIKEGVLSSEKTVLEPTRKVVTRTATIESSLFVAAMNSGLSDNLTMQLAEIFGWDIDFALNIRKGDSFSVIYEELYKEDEKIRDGSILAAEFINQGDRYRAIRYVDADGHADYYSDTGDSMRKAFLRTPVKFSRISSRFSLGRKHPVLNRIRAHRGVDYAAPKGTPIKAAGDGRVTLRGRKGGYGRTIILQHGGAYSTLYAHLNSYAKGIRQGKHVRQGQTIGYVGSSGLATGPHLHYEFRVNGVHRNPLTVKLPKATPIPKKYLADFKQKASIMTEQLDTLSRSGDNQPSEKTQLAANQH